MAGVDQIGRNRKHLNWQQPPDSMRCHIVLPGRGHAVVRVIICIAQVAILK
jgi:hypothetical protein